MDRIGAILVDTYRIERLIAEGGMGAVYEASHLRIPKKFAVKFLKVSLIDNEIALLRFRREAEVIATLDHPHIVSLLDYNMTEDGVPYTILEFLEGEHLGDRVNRGPLPIVDVLRIAEAVSGALSTAHDKGIVHRDLKPENVILGPTGGVKVVDFGIAKLRGGAELTAFNSILGTITYMAPEQLMAGQIDARADQFALGAIVYEMLTGNMPFGSDGTIPEIAERVLRHQPATVSGYPQIVTDVVLRAMAKDPVKRYVDVATFFSAFEEATRAVLGATPLAAPSSSPRVPLKPTVERPTVAPAQDRSDPLVITSPSVPIGVVDEGLPELPGDATSISTSPSARTDQVAPLPSEATVLAPLPSEATVLAPSPGEEPGAESTRITRSAAEPGPLGSETLRPGQHARPEQITGRTSPADVGLVAKLGQRGGIVIGVVIGVLIAAVVGLVLR